MYTKQIVVLWTDTFVYSMSKHFRMANAKCTSAEYSVESDS